eukprot:scaffold77897_cov44-Phaeocystis_antarctica.AAC.2
MDMDYVYDARSSGRRMPASIWRSSSSRAWSARGLLAGQLVLHPLLRLKGQGRGKSAALEAASSNTRGSGWAPSGPVSPVGALSQPELPGAP